MKCLFFIFILLTTSLAFAQAKKVAVVKMLRGEVEVMTIGRTVKLKIEDWIEVGSVVKTAEKSFVKLVFIDKSQMNIGPNSEVKIEKFSQNDPGVIDLVKGKIRSQVTKDYLQMGNSNKSKLFIKTPNAVLGIRGTHFMIYTNGVNTATVLFEGEILFNKLENRFTNNSEHLEEIVDRGVRISPGEFSVVEKNSTAPTVPSILNIKQREALEKNDTFDRRAPSSSEADEETKSVVPAGLSGKVVSNDSSILKNEISQVAGINLSSHDSSSSQDAEGFKEGDIFKPANGSIVHFESGKIIAPGADSALDANTNSYGLSPSVGSIAEDGSFVPASGGEITNDGKIITSVIGPNGKPLVIVTEPVAIKPLAPAIVSGHGVPTTSITTMTPPSILPSSPIPSGTAPLTEFVQQNTIRNRTIIVKPPSGSN